MFPDFFCMFPVVRDRHFSFPKCRNTDSRHFGLPKPRNAEGRCFGLPKCRSAEIRHFGFPKCQRSAFRISATKEKPYLLLYIKASGFQCSSVYYWSSLAEDLLYHYIIRNNKDYFNYTTHLVLSYKEHVQALATFNPQNYHNRHDNYSI